MMENLTIVDNNKIVERCNKCSAIIICKESCEYCGLKFGFSPLGNPNGAKSYFGLKNKFFDTCFLFLGHPISFWFKNSIFRSYKRNLINRFKVLSNALICVELDNAIRIMFVFEFKYLVSELFDYGIKGDQLVYFIDEESNKINMNQSAINRCLNISTIVDNIASAQNCYGLYAIESNSIKLLKAFFIVFLWASLIQFCAIIYLALR